MSCKKSLYQIVATFDKGFCMLMLSQSNANFFDLLIC